MEIVNNSDHTVQILVNGQVVEVPPVTTVEDGESTLEKVGEVVATPFVVTGKGIAKGSKFVAGKVARRIHEARLVHKGKELNRIELMIKGDALLKSEKAREAAEKAAKEAAKSTESTEVSN